MKTLLLSILILFFTFPLACADPETDYFPLVEGSFWLYQDRIEIQDADGEFEVQNKYSGDKVKVRRIDQLRTLKVLSTEIRGDFKIVKMQEEGFQGIKTFYYVIKDGSNIYHFDNEKDLEQAITEDELPIYSLTYIFPIQEGSKWGDPESLNRKDKMYFFYVEKLEDITVPIGTFKDCFKIIYHTLSDETIQWFCPYVGIVRMEYRHHGTIINHVSELKKRGIK